jgi:hypothetical protein
MKVGVFLSGGLEIIHEEARASARRSSPIGAMGGGARFDS